MKNWLIGTLATVLTLTLCGAIISTTLNDTVVNAHYLEDNFTAVNGYNRLSSALTNDVIQQSGISNIPQVSSVVSSIVTPSAVKERVNAAFSELQAYMQGKGPVPTIELNDLATQAQDAGVPVGQSSSLLQSVTLGPKSGSTNHVSLNLNSLSKGTITASVALGLIVLVFSLAWRRYTALPSVLISTGITMTVIAVLVYVAFQQLSHYLAFSNSQDSFISLGHDLMQEIGKDLGRRFGVVAIVCLAIGIPTRIWAGRLSRQVTSKPVQSKAIARLE